MRLGRIAWIAAASGVVLLAPGCPRRDCERDSDCPQGAYCDQKLGYCFRPDDPGSDASAQADGGSSDAGSHQDSGTDAGSLGRSEFCTDSHWCWANPRPNGRIHSGVYGSSDSDVWVVGVRSIMRWNGSSWLDFPAEDSDVLRAVWAESPSSAWAVGIGGIIKRWNGTEWITTSSPTNSDLYAVFGFSADEVWAVGASGTIIRWDGSGWTAENSGTSADLGSIGGSSPSKLWAVGTQGTILRHADSVWLPEQSPTPSDLHGVCATSSSDIWAISDTGEVLRTSGDSWSVARTAPSFLNRIACRGPSEAWASGDGYLLKWNGTTWTEVAGTGSADLNGIFLPAAPSNAGWAVGRYGRIFRLSNGNWSQAHADPINSEITALGGAAASTILVGTLNGRILSCSPSGDCSQEFAVDAGAVTALTGAETVQPWGIAGDKVLLGSVGGWSELPAGGPLTALAARQVSGTTDEAWVVGQDLVKRCSRDSCGPSLVSGTGTLRDVAIDGEEAVTVDSERFYRCALNSCTPLEFPEAISVNALWSPRPGVVWGAGNGGKLVRIAGTTATVEQLPTGANLLAIGGRGEEDAWVAGASGTILHRTASGWTEMESGTNQPINAIQAFSSGTVVAGGKNSMLLRYDP